MKNTIKIFGIILFAAVIGITMIACGGGGGGKIPDGTYVGEAFGAEFLYTFSGNKVTFSGFGVEGVSTYEIKADTITIAGKKETIRTLILTDEAGNKTETGYTIDGKKLTIQGIELTKK